MVIDARLSTFVLSSIKRILDPLGGCVRYLTGFLFLWHAGRAILWLKRSLVQVKRVLDASKPHGQEFVFIGDFFFCFLFSKVLTRCFFLCFLLSRTIYNNKSRAAIRRLIGFLKSKGFYYNAQKFTVLQAEFERLTGLTKPPKLKFRAWICYLYNTQSPFLPLIKTKRKLKKEKRVKKGKDRNLYYEYLKSKEWEAFRQKALDFYGRECTKCQSTHRLQVHHKTYKNIFKEELEDVTILCETCHEKVHGRKFKYS